MRNYFLLFTLFSLNVVVSYAANNFLTVDKTWTVLQKIDETLTSPAEELITYYKVGSDSSVNDIIYKQIHRSEDNANWELDCLMREEADKVYIREKDADFESVLYDFGLEVNEHTDYDDGSITLRSRLTAVEDTIISGQVRKIYSIDASSDSFGEVVVPGERWVEGIGSLYGLKRQSCRFSTGCYSTFSLLQVSANGEIFYEYPGSEHLDITLGQDTTFCVTWSDDIYLADQLQVTGGVPPYTYTWSGEIACYEGGTQPLSRFLNDTTVENPYFRDYGDHRVWNTVFLTVEDSNKQSVTASFNIRFSMLFSYILEDVPIYVQAGDSVLFDLSGADYGGILPYSSFSWQSQEGLSDPDSSTTWCKPTQEIRYVCIVIDSVGCSVDIPVFWVVPKESSSLPSVQEDMNRYQAGNTLHFNNASGDEVTLSFYETNGKLVYRNKTTQSSYTPRLDKPGIYVGVLQKKGVRDSFKYLYSGD